MSKYVADTYLDNLVTGPATDATELYLCTGDPTTRAEARTNSVTDTTTPETPPGTVGPQDAAGGGREINWQAKAGLSITAGGNASVVCLCNGTTLLLKTDLDQALVVAINDTVDLGSFSHSVGDAA